MRNTSISVDFNSKSLTNSEIVSQLATCDTNFMICGENGMDKELLARVIHSNSSRGTNPFIPADCAALPENLLQRNLFGYENAETKSMCRGLVECADQGTLFLDEVCNLTPQLQANLLKVLQGRKFRRVGGKHAIKVNLRIISASTKKPSEAFKSGLLRNDFFNQQKIIYLNQPFRLNYDFDQLGKASEVAGLIEEDETQQCLMVNS